MDDQDLPPTTSGDLSDAQQILRIILEICSALLSVIGSSTIVIKILHDRAINGYTTPYDRIMLGLSSCDILASITWVTTNFISPIERGGIWAFGNDATCQARAFLVQLSFSAWWYNCILSFYFLLTVLSQIRQKNFVGKCEVWMHLTVMFYPITAFMGLHRGWYGDDCWIADAKIKWIVAGIPIFATYLSLIINNIVIYAIFRSLTSVQTRLKREATALMFLYVACFFVTVSPSIVSEILYTYFGYTSDDAVKLYPLKIFEAILLPLQGFFNFFIYIKPSYARFRAVNADKSMYFVLHQALFNPNVPQSTFSGNQPTSNAIAEEGTANNPNRALFNSNFSPYSSSSSDLSFGASEGEGRNSESIAVEDVTKEEDEKLSDSNAEN